MITTKQELLQAIGSFTWCWGQDFIVEIGSQTFVWKDPDYNGDNSFTEQAGTYADVLKSMGIDHGRCKGDHIVERYCGDQINVTFLEQKLN